MKLFAFVLATAVLTAPAARHQHETSLTIDGSRNPEMFPQWYVWELAFQQLGQESKRTRFPLQKQLGLSDAEYKVVMDEVKVFNQLTETLRKELADTIAVATAARKNEEQIRDATQVVDLNYRYKILEGRQRIHDQLPRERLTLLRAWIDDIVRGTTVFLSGRAVRFFRQPW